MSETNKELGQQDLSSLYVSEDLHPAEVFGVKVMFREIPGPEYMRLTNRCLIQKNGQETLDREKYAVQLLKAMIAEPKGIEVSKLTGGALAQLLMEAEKFIGVSEDMLKKSEPR